jgi:anti-sigma factor RsiW
MKFSDETLMAYADGELDDVQRAEIDRALDADPALADRVAQHQSLRLDVFAAFAPILDEAVPPALTAAALPGKVADLNAARAARVEQAAAVRRRWSWPEWGAIAATLAVGVLVGSTVTGTGGDVAVTLAQGTGGKLVAQGQLATALSQQLAVSEGTVRIGVSFAAKDGTLCRSFITNGTAGLACRNGKEWNVPVIAEAVSAAAGDYQQAGSAMPAAVLDAIDARIAGQTLDAKGEQEALQRGWQAKPAP